MFLAVRARIVRGTSFRFASYASHSLSASSSSSSISESSLSTSGLGFGGPGMRATGPRKIRVTTLPSGTDIVPIMPMLAVASLPPASFSVSNTASRVPELLRTTTSSSRDPTNAPSRPGTHQDPGDTMASESDVAEKW